VKTLDKLRLPTRPPSGDTKRGYRFGNVAPPSPPGLTRFARSHAMNSAARPSGVLGLDRQPRRADAGVDLALGDIEGDNACLLWHTPGIPELDTNQRRTIIATGPVRLF
jgi:hypothetical protein